MSTTPTPVATTQTQGKGMGILNAISLGVSLLPFVEQAIVSVENLFGKGNGQSKKGAVITMTQAALNGFLAVKGQQNLDQTDNDKLNQTIDNIVYFKNKFGW